MATKKVKGKIKKKKKKEVEELDDKTVVIPQLQKEEFFIPKKKTFNPQRDVYEETTPLTPLKKEKPLSQLSEESEDKYEKTFVIDTKALQRKKKKEKIKKFYEKYQIHIWIGIMLFFFIVWMILTSLTLKGE